MTEPVLNVSLCDGKFLYTVNYQLISGLSEAQYNNLKFVLSEMVNNEAFKDKDKNILDEKPKKYSFEYEFIGDSKVKVFFNTFEEFSNIYNVKCFHKMAHFNGFVINDNKDVFVYYTEPIRKIKIGSFSEVPDFCCTNPIFKILVNLHDKMNDIIKNQKSVPAGVHEMLMKNPQDFV